MKITINKETFINNPCPIITKNMWDWYWYNLYVSARNSGTLEGVKKINTIDIRINQSYKGDYKIHFYTSINGGEEFHRYWTGVWEFLNDFDLPRNNQYKKYRYDWHKDFINMAKIDLGTTKQIERYKKRWDIIDLKSKSKEITKSLVYKFNQFNELKEFFNYQ